MTLVLILIVGKSLPTRLKNIVDSQDTTLILLLKIVVVKAPQFDVQVFYDEAIVGEFTHVSDVFLLDYDIYYVLVLRF